MSDFLRILGPAVVLVVGASVIFLLAAVRSPVLRRYLPNLTLLTIVVAGLVSFSFQGCFSCGPIDVLAPDGSVRLGSTGLMTIYITLAIGALLVLISWYPDRGALGTTTNTNPNTQSKDSDSDTWSVAGEYFAMLLTSLAGLILVAVANNLIVLFLALELVSIPTYFMVTLSRPSLQAKEAGLKYFFLGALAAAVLAYGMSFLYGITGSIQLDIIAVELAHRPGSLCVVALALIMVGLCFKIAAVPMHFYAADVYQGAASPVTALVAFLPKFAGFYGLLLIINYAIWPLARASGHIADVTVWILWILAAATMTIGNTLALMQRNVKRLLAYSSIAHSGYIMLALLTDRGETGTLIAAIIFYITVYAIATLGAFAVLAMIERRGDEAQQIDDLVGLARRHPALAAALAICVFSLLGMPLTGGFVGKLYVFRALMGSTVLAHQWIIVLLVIALVNAAVAAGYYLRIIAACYISDGPLTVEVRTTGHQATGIALATAMTIILGIAPALLFKPLVKLDLPAPPIMVSQIGIPAPPAIVGRIGAPVVNNSAWSGSASEPQIATAAPLRAAQKTMNYHGYPGNNSPGPANKDRKKGTAK